MWKWKQHAERAVCNNMVESSRALFERGCLCGCVCDAGRDYVCAVITTVRGRRA